MDVRTARKLLGVAPADDAAALKRAYMSAALKHHPDKGGQDQLFVLTNEAYSVLLDDFKLRAKTRITRMYEVRVAAVCADFVGDARATYRDRCRRCDGLGAASATDIVSCISCAGVGCPSCHGQGLLIKKGKECAMCGGAGSARKHAIVPVRIPAGVASGTCVGRHDDRDVIVTHDLDISGWDVTQTVTLGLRDLLCGFSVKVRTYRGEQDVSTSGPFELHPIVMQSHGILGRGDYIVVPTLVISAEDVAFAAKYSPVFLKMYGACDDGA